MLINEMFNQQGSEISFRIGKPIPWKSIAELDLPHLTGWLMTKITSAHLSSLRKSWLTMALVCRYFISNMWSYANRGDVNF